MADYYELIARAVAGLEKSTPQNRHAIYERARAALIARLRAIDDPQLDEHDIAREQAALEEAIGRVERGVDVAPKPAAAASRTPSGAADRGTESKGLDAGSSELPKVFISYRRDDSKYQARDIYRALIRVLRRDHVFMDIDTIVPGENFVRTLEQWVEQCDIVLALIGNGWATAADPKSGTLRLHNPQDFVRIEIRKALARNIPVVPIILDGAAIPEERNLPDDMRELAQRHAEFVDFRTFDSDVERLIRKLELAGRPTY
jgi:hypothetical protein